MDLIILIFLTRYIGKLATKKGVKALNWKIYTVFGFIISEFIGVIAGVMIFGKDNLFSILLVGLTFALTSYYIVRAQLNKLPDQDIDEDINNIGQN